MSNNLFKKIMTNFNYNYDDITSLNNPLECEDAFNKLITNMGYNYDVIKAVIILLNDKLSNDKVVKDNSVLYLSIIKFLMYMKSLGFDNNEVLKIFKIYPQLVIINIETLDSKLDELSKRFGYTKDDLKNMIKRYPLLLALNMEYICQRINELTSLGYTQTQVKEMTILSPGLFSLNMENIIEKDSFYNVLGLKGIFTKSSDSVSFIVELAYARYMFLKWNGIEINLDNCELLFDNNFESKYAISNAQLMEKFPYPGDTFKKKK